VKFFTAASTRLTRKKTITISYFKYLVLKSFKACVLPVPKELIKQISFGALVRSIKPLGKYCSLSTFVTGNVQPRLDAELATELLIPELVTEVICREYNYYSFLVEI
jgi:hypothetical protein